jgi:hypothetical protein
MAALMGVEMIEAFLPIYLFVVACGVVAMAAYARGRNPTGWFVIALLITPILAFAAVLSIPKQERKRKASLLDGRAFKDSEV